MAETVRLRIEVEDDAVIVTLPGTTFRVIYRRLNRSPALIACGVLGDKRAGIREVDFLARTGAGLVVVVIGEAFAVYQKPSHLKFVQSPLLSASVCQVCTGRLTNPRMGSGFWE